MNKFKAKKNPSLVLHTRDYLFQELQAWRELIKGEWPWMLMLVAGVTLLLAFTRPLPPSTVYLAVGQPGSIFQVMGEKFVPYFEKQGIKLNLVTTAGSENSLEDLANVNNPVSAALMVGGLAFRDSQPRLASLGSIEYVPLWLFYRGEKFEGKTAVAHLSDRLVAVGPQGSGTFTLLHRILALSNIDIDGRPNFLRMSNAEAADQLIAGKIDAVFLLDGIDSANVQKLLQRSDLGIFNFEYAPAVVKKLPYLESVVIPKGALDLTNLRPAEDVHMLATSATLLIEKTMHPAIQHIFLISAEKISREVDQFFARPGAFPAYIDHSMPLSSVAQRYYDQGPPPFKDDLPLWLVSYLDRIWILAVGFLAIIYPMFKLFPSYRHTRAVMMISDAYEEILEIDRRAAQTDSIAELQSLINQLEEMNNDSRDISISSDEISRLYSMKSILKMVHDQIVTRKGKLEELKPIGSSSE